jgi:hypothetical protein
MAYTDSKGPGMVMFSPKQPTFGINIMLLLIVIGLAIIIFLLLFWFPKYWGWGGKVIGADGKVMTGGGGIIVNAACCDATGGRCPTCPECPGTNGCEENCRTRYANSPTAMKTCIDVECNDGDTCERSCWKRYAGQTTAYNSCIRQECTDGGTTGTPMYPQTPTTPTGTPMYPQTPTCEEDCREKYSNQPTVMKRCLDQCRPSSATVV